MKKVLELVDIKKHFTQGDHKIDVLKGVSFTLKQGEFVALTGPSGSGKTTLLQIAGLLDASSSGKIIINNYDASNSDDEKRTQLRKDNIGFVYQFHHLLPEFSALENVMLPLLIKGENKDNAKAAAKKILEEVDLKNRLNHKPRIQQCGSQLQS